MVDGALTVLNIKNEEAQRLSRELAELTGETVTTAVLVAVRERLERMRADRDEGEQRAARIVALGRQTAAAVPPPGLSIEDLYD